MKRIVHIIVGLNVGGAELMLQRLVLNSNNYEHTVISLTDLGVIGPKLQKEGVSVYSLHMQSLLSFPCTLYKLRKLINNIDPIAIQCWMDHANLIGGIVGKSLRIENIIWGIRTDHIHNDKSFTRKQIVNICTKLSYIIPNKVVCVANKVKNTHIKYGYDPNKMLVITNGFETSKFYPNLKLRKNLRRKLNIKPSELVIGNIGRFNPVKNHKNFIKACIALLQDGYEFKVLLAGRDVNLSNPSISELFKHNDTSKNFIFLSEIDDTPSFYNAIDVLCLCSITEGFPNVLGEAMATGKICLSTDAGDAWAILGDSGYKIESSSYRDIYKAIETNILQNSKTTLVDMSNRALNRIESDYTLEKIIAQFENLYTC